MRHGNKLRKLGRDSKHRRALLRNLTTSLVLKERIVTTYAKAAELKRYAEKVITAAKRGNEIRVRATLFTQPAVKKLLFELKQRYYDRPGGYTRMFRLGARQRDAAQMAVIELVDRPGELLLAKKYRVQEQRRKGLEKTAQTIADLQRRGLTVDFRAKRIEQKTEYVRRRGSLPREIAAAAGFINPVLGASLPRKSTPASLVAQHFGFDAPALGALPPPPPLASVDVWAKPRPKPQYELGEYYARFALPHAEADRRDALMREIEEKEAKEEEAKAAAAAAAAGGGGAAPAGGAAAGKAAPAGKR